MGRLICALLIICSGPLSAQSNLLKQDLQKIYTQIQLFNFRTADTLLQSKSISANNEVQQLARANFFWWLIVSGEDNDQNRKSYFNSSDLVLNKFNDTNPEKLKNEQLYIVITAYANKARIEGLNKNYFRGFSYINTCLRYIKRSFGKETEFEYFNLTSGLYNYYMATANKNFPLLLPYLALFPKGDLEKGIELLNKAASSADPALQTEAHYFLMKLYMEENKFQNAEDHCLWLKKAYASNLLYTFYHFKILLDNNQKDAALKVMSELRLKEMMHPQLTSGQRKYFSGLATEELRKYYSKKQ